MAEMPMGGAGMTGAAPAAMPAAPAGGPPGGSPGGPTGSPMSTPQPQEGLQKAAKVQVQIAVQQLQRILPAFPFDSDESKAVMNALKSLQSGFGKTENEDRSLVPSEILSLLATANTPNSPGAGAMAARPSPGAQPAGAGPGPIPS